jgi:hypothetical protein
LFDEHGGCYDHVPPPSADSNCPVAIAPDDKIIPPGQPGGVGFKFDRLGPRVPAIVISPHTPAQTRLHQTFDNTSILKTIVNCFNLPNDRLGKRQSKALDVSGALKLSNARYNHSTIVVPHVSLLEDAKAEWHFLVHSKLLRAQQKPDTDLQRHALHAMHGPLHTSTGSP